MSGKRRVRAGIAALLLWVGCESAMAGRGILDQLTSRDLLAANPAKVEYGVTWSWVDHEFGTAQGASGRWQVFLTRNERGQVEAYVDAGREQRPWWTGVRYRCTEEGDSWEIVSRPSSEEVTAFYSDGESATGTVTHTKVKTRGGKGVTRIRFDGGDWFRTRLKGRKREEVQRQEVIDWMREMASRGGTLSVDLSVERRKPWRWSWKPARQKATIALRGAGNAIKVARLHCGIK